MGGGALIVSDGRYAARCLRIFYLKRARRRAEGNPRYGKLKPRGLMSRNVLSARILPESAVGMGNNEGLPMGFDPREYFYSGDGENSPIADGYGGTILDDQARFR